MHHDCSFGEHSGPGCVHSEPRDVVRRKDGTPLVLDSQEIDDVEFGQVLIEVGRETLISCAREELLGADESESCTKLGQRRDEPGCHPAIGYVANYPDLEPFEMFEVASDSQSIEECLCRVLGTSGTGIDDGKTGPLCGQERCVVLDVSDDQYLGPERGESEKTVPQRLALLCG